MKLDIFYSWQSDIPTTKRFIATCLNSIAKEKIGEFYINISSDARNSKGSVNLTDALFKKINQSTIFVADLTLINNESTGRKCCNPNVLIELGYAMNNLGINNILMLFDTKYGNVEDLPFDIRQNRIIKFNSDKDKKSLKNILYSEICNIILNINPAIYDFLYSEIDNQIIAHLMEFSKIFYFNSNIKQRYNHMYFIEKSESELEEDINNNEFLGFELFNNLTILENQFEEFLNKKTNESFFNEHASRLLSKVILSMKSISKFLNYEPFFTQTAYLGNEYKIVSAKSINPYNDEKLVLLKQAGTPLNNNGVVISANYITPSKIHSMRNIYKCINSKYFVKVIKNYVNSISEWNDYMDNNLFRLLENSNT